MRESGSLAIQQVDELGLFQPSFRLVRYGQLVEPRDAGVAGENAVFELSDLGAFGERAEGERVGS